jgi:hypothetical protein
LALAAALLAVDLHLVTGIRTATFAKPVLLPVLLLVLSYFQNFDFSQAAALLQRQNAPLKSENQAGRHFF